MLGLRLEGFWISSGLFMGLGEDYFGFCGAIFTGLVLIGGEIFWGFVNCGCVCCCWTIGFLCVGFIKLGYTVPKAISFGEGLPFCSSVLLTALILPNAVSTFLVRSLRFTATLTFRLRLGDIWSWCDEIWWVCCCGEWLCCFYRMVSVCRVAVGDCFTTVTFLTVSSVFSAFCGGDFC